MNKTEILNTIKLVKDKTRKRNFNQTFDLIINLKDFDVKKSSLDTYLVFPFDTGKKIKVCAFVGKDLLTQAKDIFDKIIFDEEFSNWTKDKKEIQKLASEYDFFVAQANLMGQIATTFGKALGPRGKMPDPKSGCIVQPKISAFDLRKLYDNLKRTIKISTKGEAIMKCGVGNESMDDEKIVENVLAVYNFVVHLLPLEDNNVATVLVKLTMGPTIKVGEKKEDIEKRLENKSKEKPKSSYKDRKEVKKVEEKVTDLKDKKKKETEK